MTRILLTGFGAFPGAPDNPTQAIVHGLNARGRTGLQRICIDLKAAVLPVDYHNVESSLTAMLAAHHPDVVVLLGLAARRDAICVETRALNRLSIIHPDANRALANTKTIRKNARTIASARWPVLRLAQAINASGSLARPSIDAGDYLCNQALFLALEKFDGLCGFIHVPKPRRNLPLWAKRKPQGVPNHRLPNLLNLERAIVTALRLLATEHRRFTH